MNWSLPLATYRAASLVARRLPLGAKAATGLAGRRDAVERWVSWALGRRTPGRLAWVHAASVGEALTAEPVVRRLQRALPDLQVVLTFSSPSLARWLVNSPLPVAAADFVPPEDPCATQAVVAALAPNLLVFSRTDLWPELLLAAHARAVPVAVLGGTVRDGSLRLRWPARPFLRDLVRPIRFVGATTPDHAARWERLGVPGAAISVTGDPRHDQVLERVTDLSHVRGLLSWAGAGPTIVAGSVEPADEALVIGAFAVLQRARAETRLFLVPHDPTPAVLHRLLERAARAGVAGTAWHGGTVPTTTPCLVAGRVGMLADLYLLGTVAYIGGGFRRNGLHAVIEPAACGVPSVFGPEHATSDAELLLARGGAVALPRRGAARALSIQWERWLADPQAGRRAGMAARAALQQGAAALTTRRLLALL